MIPPWKGKNPIYLGSLPLYRLIILSFLKMLDLAIIFLSFMGLFVHYPQNWKKTFIIIISQTFVEIKNLIHEELQLFNSIKTHHISSTSTIMKDLYCLFPELFTFETKSNYYDLVFMGRFKKYCPCNLCLISTNSKRELRSLGRPAELWSARFIR